MPDRMLSVMPTYEPPERPPWAQSMRPSPRRNWFSRHPLVSACLIFLLTAVLAITIFYGVTDR